LANNGELDGRRYLSPAAMDELRKEQTGETKINYSLGYHLRNGMFGHDGAYGTDLSVNPKTGMIAVFMVQCTSGDQWSARDLFLKTATDIFLRPNQDNDCRGGPKPTRAVTLPASPLSHRPNRSNREWDGPQ
jgi:CubicO group peptidase (beta-lactamase class C family)